MKKSRIVDSAALVAQRLVLCAVAAALLSNCGAEGDKVNRDLERAALEKARLQNPADELSENELDTLRAMKKRFRITRDEYWEVRGGVLENDFFELWYPAGSMTVSHGMFAFGQLVAAKGRFHRFFGRDPGDHLTVICTPTMFDFNEETGLEWWVYSKIDGDKISYQPIYILYQRSLGEVGVRRGYHEWGIEKLSGVRSPRWLVQGLSSLLSDEEWFLENQLTEFPDDDVKMSLKEIKEALKKKDDKKTYRFALYNAYRMVRRLAARDGQDKLAEVVLTIGAGGKAKTAFEEVYGQSYDEVVGYALDFKVSR